VPRDFQKAQAAYAKGCEIGVVEDCASLAQMLRKRPDGLPADPAVSVPYYTKACDGGIAVACYELGNLYLKGSGVKQDTARSVELLKKACAAGDQRGCAQTRGR
jgi:TPR repeat protein